MYQVFYGDDLLYDVRGGNIYTLISPTLKLAANSAGSFTFSIRPDHPAFDSLALMVGAVKVVDLDAGAGTEETIFLGRIVRIERRFDLSREVECEGLLGCLNDTLVAPHSFPENYADDFGYQSAAASGNVVAFWLGKLLTQHNSMCYLEGHRILLGNITVSDSNNYIIRESDDVQTTWQTIVADTVNSNLGGYIVARYRGDAVYLDYLSAFTDTNSQTIQFAENMIDATDAQDGTDFYNVVFARGANGLTISSLANGAYGNYYKSGQYLMDLSARDSYGHICRCITWDEITTASDLIAKAAAALDAHSNVLPRTLTISALDLSSVRTGISRFKLGQLVSVQSIPHGLSVAYPLTEITVALLDPTGNKITVGAIEQTISGAVSAQTRAARTTF